LPATSGFVSIVICVLLTAVTSAFSESPIRRRRSGPVLSWLELLTASVVAAASTCAVRVATGCADALATEMTAGLDPLRVMVGLALNPGTHVIQLEMFVLGTPYLPLRRLSVTMFMPSRRLASIVDCASARR